MSEVTGVVQKVFSKDGRWALLIDDEWYGLGRNKPSLEEGYTARFEMSMNGKYKNVVDGTLKAKYGEAVKTNGAKRTGGKSNFQDKDKYWKEREARDIDNQKRISYQAATNTALTLISSAIANEVLKVPTAKSAADRLGAFQAMVQEEADRIFVIYQTTDFDALSAGTEPEAADVDIKEEDEEWGDA